MEIEHILADMLKRKASDLHIRVGGQPVYRIHGKLLRLQVEPITGEMMEGFLNRLMDGDRRRLFTERQEMDFALGLPGVGRFRVNVYNQRNTPALAIRSVAVSIPDFEALGLPEVIRDLSLRRRGLILVTGATGSGKSTALAAMVQHINEHTASHIITVEDPIEFLHRDQKSIVSQREVGQDTGSFSLALRSALRQDPDVILVGEIRDPETMSIALTSADTGHLVLSTLHTMNAVETVSRIMSFYPPHQQEQVRLLLSGTLVAVISLRLLPTPDGAARVPACEILVVSAAIRELLLHPAAGSQIVEAMQEGYTQYGSQSFDQSILRLFQDEKISYETAVQNASSPEDFALKVKGIEGTSDRRWTGV